MNQALGGKNLSVEISDTPSAVHAKGQDQLSMTPKESTNMERGSHGDMVEAEEFVRPSVYEYGLVVIFMAFFCWAHWATPLWPQIINISPDGHGDVSIDYPVIFGPAALIKHITPLYCNATDIHYCAAHKDATKEQGYPCCPYLLKGTPPANQITNAVVVSVSFFVPAVLIPASSYFTYYTVHKHRKGMWAEWRAGWIGFLFAYTSNLMLMEACKKSIGVPRPNFYSLSALLDYDRIMKTDHYSRFGPDGANERYLNVPSGHASCSMCSFLFLGLFFINKTKALFPLTTNRKRNCLRSFLIGVACIPFCVSVWIGGTRIEDYWHSVPAVILGFLLGFACAVFGFFGYSYSYLTIIYGQPFYHLPAPKKPGDLL